MEQTLQKRTRLSIIAMILAAIAVVGVLGFLTGVFQFNADDEVETITATTPSPTPTPAPRITPEGASITTITSQAPGVTEVQTSAPTGPLDGIFLLLGIAIFLGFGGNLFLAKFA